MVVHFKNRRAAEVAMGRAAQFGDRYYMVIFSKLTSVIQVPLLQPRNRYSRNRLSSNRLLSKITDKIDKLKHTVYNITLQFSHIHKFTIALYILQNI